MARSKVKEWLEPEGLLKIEGWARDGLIDKQIAENMGVAYSTLRSWRDKHPALSAALKKSKSVADRHVENSLYERACGGTHTVRKHIKVKQTYYDSQGRKCEKEEIKEVMDEVYVPGDTTAEIFWLKNRMPEKWRDKQIVEAEVGVTKLEDLLK